MDHLIQQIETVSPTAEAVIEEQSEHIQNVQMRDYQVHIYVGLQAKWSRRRKHVIVNFSTFETLCFFFRLCFLR